MPCPGIANFDNIKLDELEKEYNKLTNENDKAKFKSCLQEKYSSFSPKCDVLPDLLTDYDKRIEKNITATEKNEQSRQQYITDVFYLIFKIIMFVILGIFYYIFIKTPQTAIDSLKSASDMVKDTIKDTTESIKSSVESISTNKLKD